MTDLYKTKNHVFFVGSTRQILLNLAFLAHSSRILDNENKSYVACHNLPQQGVTKTLRPILAIIMANPYISNTDLWLS